MTTSSGFIITDVDTIDYRGEKEPGEGVWYTSFFRTMAVKSIGETHHSSIASRSAEFAATRGSCGVQEVKA